MSAHYITEHTSAGILVREIDAGGERRWLATDQGDFAHCKSDKGAFALVNPVNVPADVLREIAKAKASDGDPVITYDRETNVVTIDGFKFARELLTQITASPPGIRFRIVERKDGTITFAQDRDPLEAAAPELLKVVDLVLNESGSVQDSQSCIELYKAALKARAMVPA